MKRGLAGLLLAAIAALTIACGSTTPNAPTSYPPAETPVAASSPTPTPTPTPTYYIGSDPALDTYVQTQMTKAHCPGLELCIVKNGRIAFSTAYGWANIEDQIPMTPDSLLEIASISKTVVATATMQCVERGTLTLDEDIDAALGWTARNPSYSTIAVTPRMLMTHSSSICDSAQIWSYYKYGADSPIGLDDFIRGYLTPRGAYWIQANWGNYRPGSRYSYSNSGAATCGDVVERASGTPFDIWCRTHIFQPLGMADTSWRLRDLPASRLAMPYEWQNHHYVAKGQYGYPDYPDGMLHTCANQFGKFMIAYLQGGIYKGHRILQQATVDSMLSSWVPDLDPTQGAFWYSNSSLVSGRTLWGHNGGDYGISSEMWLDRGRHEGVFVLANGDAESNTVRATAFEAIVTRLFQKADSL